MIYSISESNYANRFDAKIELDGGHVLLHSRGGSTGGKPRRNPDYEKALLTIVRRLRAQDSPGTLTITEVLLDSTKARSLPKKDRLLATSSDLSGRSNEEVVSLIRQRASKWGQAPDAKGGNSTKALRIETGSRSHASIRSTLNLMKWDHVKSPAEIERLSRTEQRKVKPSHIHRAVKLLLAGKTMPSFAESTDYDVLLPDGTRLAPKRVFGLALEEALGIEAFPGHFSSGWGLSCFDIIEAAGYDIVEKEEQFPAADQNEILPRPETEIFHDAIAAIEAAAGAYEIAGLQRFRARNRGLSRVAQSIFGRKRRADDWAFHLGGRDELQFNVGLDFMPDGGRAFRAGVAFSFEPSRSLPDFEILIPKVARFNAWMRENREHLSDFAMWHWQDGTRSVDYLPAPIPDRLIRNQVFVFLGHRQPLTNLDPHSALGTFDRLLPIYKWVESRAVPVATGAIETMRLHGGREIDGGEWIKATTRERTLDIYLRHREIQRRLKAELLKEGCHEVICEVPIGLRSIDLVARHGSELWFYEVKTAATVRSCLREAIGQLLEYALWPGATCPARLVVVGEPAMDRTAHKYLERLNEVFPVPVSYRQHALDEWVAPRAPPH